VKALLLWIDTQKSGATLAGATVVYFLLEMSGYTMLYLIPTLMLVAVIASFVFSAGSRFLGRRSVPCPYFPPGIFHLGCHDRCCKQVGFAGSSGTKSPT
jgi:hypothetical protein